MHPAALLDQAAHLIEQLLPFQHPADAVVARHFRQHKQLGPRERAVLAESAYLVLRQRRWLEHLARTGDGRTVGAMPRRLALLGWAMATRDGLVAGSIDFVLGAVKPTERSWLQAALAANPADGLAPHRHNLPDWLAQALADEAGADFDALAASLLAAAPLDLRVNTLLAKRDDVLAELRAAGLQPEPTPWSPWGLRLSGRPMVNQLAAFTRGAVEVQDEGSQLLALLLAPKRGEMVVDFCAGAGGKTLALGAQMRNTGRLYAMDVSAHRLDALKPRLARSGLSNVHPVAIAHERDERVKRLVGKIDRVLVDAPCSGLGTLRRNPDLKWRQTAADVAELVQRQQAIAVSAARLLKPGGRLVYATCSLLRTENEELAQTIQTTCAAQGVVLQAMHVQEALGGQIDATPLVNAHGQLRLWPQRHGTDGFFAAVWQRQA
jgi:16S rRNA (cytosine967-C5)-methyltransferase